MAQFEAPAQWLEKEIKQPLRHKEKITVPCTIHIYDVQQNHLATGTVLWQLKGWSFVKTR